MKLNVIVALMLAASFALIGCNKVPAVKCTDKLKDIATATKEIGTSFQVACPAGCTTGGSVYGTDVYTTDSPVCIAAVHAGVIEAAKGGTIKVSIVKSLPSYKGSERNGVTTSDWATSWGDTAYTVAK